MERKGWGKIFEGREWGWGLIVSVHPLNCSLLWMNMVEVLFIQALEWLESHDEVKRAKCLYGWYCSSQTELLRFGDIGAMREKKRKHPPSLGFNLDKQQEPAWGCNLAHMGLKGLWSTLVPDPPCLILPQMLSVTTITVYGDLVSLL